MKNLRKIFNGLPRITKLYLARSFFSALFFTWPIWYGFASEQLTATQVGLYFSVVYVTQLIGEIPTGIYADKYGRRKSALIGASLLPITPLILYLGHSFEAYLTAAFLYGISGAFLSGSLDSLMYDDRKVDSTLFRKVSMYDVTLFQSGLITSALLGGFLYQLNTFLPFLFESLAGVGSFLIILKMNENYRPQGKDVLQSGKYISYLKDGLKYLLATKELYYFVGAYLLFTVAITASIEFVNEANMIGYGIAPAWRGVAISATKILNLLLLNLVIYRFIKSDQIKILFISAVSIAVFGLFLVPSIHLFLLVYVLFNWISASRSAFLNPIIHDKIPTSHRATTMSSLSALIGVASLILYPAAGWLMENFKQPRVAYALFFMMVVLASAFMWRSQKKEVSPLT
ncbi:MAG: MFS transporter [Microgenomates group bacterium]